MTNQVIDMNNMFGNCTNLETIEFSDKFNTSKVVNMEYMFGGCWGLRNLDVSCFDTSNVESMALMFSHNDLTTLDLSNFNTSKVTKMSGMFMHTYQLNIVYVGPNWTTQNADTTDMFKDSKISSTTLK